MATVDVADSSLQADLLSKMVFLKLNLFLPPRFSFDLRRGAGSFK